ncbi:glutenin, high molecular weight subunit PW212-like [Actinia tenebrosa]|uniref:Glutenin, high molecular weight subunit PW212-like n=1 Tax=Actinia tenebrosa TaxID=6105 RepID=A0A6P8IAN9_ACTTE|nr:glutenin, high molecular weight subunit PW212-like [Actinia tenebrosa]
MNNGNNQGTNYGNNQNGNNGNNNVNQGNGQGGGTNIQPVSLLGVIPLQAATSQGNQPNNNGNPSQQSQPNNSVPSNGMPSNGGQGPGNTSNGQQQPSSSNPQPNNGGQTNPQGNQNPNQGQQPGGKPNGGQPSPNGQGSQGQPQPSPSPTPPAGQQNPNTSTQQPGSGQQTTTPGSGQTTSLGQTTKPTVPNNGGNCTTPNPTGSQAPKESQKPGQGKNRKKVTPILTLPGFMIPMPMRHPHLMRLPHPIHPMMMHRYPHPGFMMNPPPLVGDDHVLIGQCQDLDPGCASMALSGLCDREVARYSCMASCGYCRSFVKFGQHVSLDTRHKTAKAKPQVPKNYPEYNSEFLRSIITRPKRIKTDITINNIR